MRAPKLTRHIWWAGEILLLAATAFAAVHLSQPQEWHPAVLVALLVVLALVGERFSVQLSEGELSASTVAIVLAMGLLGPTPAALCGIAAMVLASATRGLSPGLWLNNLAAFAAVPFVGGLIVRGLAGYLGVLENTHLAQAGILGLLLLGIFIATLPLNFVLIGINTVVEQGRSFSRQLPDFLPLFPGELAAGALATILAIAYRSAGLPVLLAAIVLLLIFQHLTVALVRSEERAEQLQVRSRQL